ncbi:MAG: PQQ-dependent sugar dehydrogenase [Chloroflexi bacterium]|nr:MAG: PQQ-dependent sugar dehydrogenase [Chloroflexota bacterium]
MNAFPPAKLAGLGLSLIMLPACASSTSVQQSSPTATATATPQASPRLTTYVAAQFATALAWAPGGRLFFSERAGTVRVFDGHSARDFARVSTSTSGERGLLGIAISPSFATDHFVYAFYSRADDERPAQPPSSTICPPDLTVATRVGGWPLVPTASCT